MNEQLFLKLAAMQQPATVFYGDLMSDVVDVVNLARSGQKVNVIFIGAYETSLARFKNEIAALSISVGEFILEERKIESILVLMIALSKPCISPMSVDRKRLFDRLVDDLEPMTVRATKCLAFAKIHYIGQLVQKAETVSLHTGTEDKVRCIR